MQKITKTILIFAFSLTLMVANFPLLAAKEIVIKFSHVVSPNTPKGKTADLFAKMVNVRLAGKIRVEVYPNSQLYNDNKVMEAMRMSQSRHTGIMAAPSLSKFVKFSQTIQAFDIPFLFHNIDDVHKLADAPIIGKMTDPLKTKGIHPLALWDNGMKVFSIRGDKPLRNVPADFTGKKFRIQTSDIHAEMIKSLGGIPQKLPFKEVYAALGQGVVDGQENAWSNVYSKKFHEVQDWITVSNHSYLGYLVVISEQFWKGLPGDIQNELTGIMREATIASRKFSADADKSNRETIKQAGKAKIVELTPDERNQWIKATSQIEEKFKNKIGEKLLGDIHAILGH